MTPDARAKLEAWLDYFDDLGLAPFYSDRASLELPSAIPIAGAQHAAPAVGAGFSPPSSAPRVAPAFKPASVAAPPPVISVKQAPSLFEILDRVENDSIEKIRADIGDCTRCALSQHRHSIVYGVGNPRAELMFVGEGPGADEDAQGIPFVGRAGQLLTQMIEAMGLRREDVYIANVVKCRPPGNRLPEKEEIATCSPFLIRQIDAIKPKVLVALGACAVQTLLAAPVAITKIRGQWYDYRGIRMMPTFHPAFLLRDPRAKPDAWRDLQKVMAVLGLRPPKKKP
ncbi:MAG TPA: uracil-DNA glycosylase [Candidatus Acidoferrales bacterium]|nr:uracil-DNA glycosylase [Candidatus Acidoferrales bacterium]